jgi:uncharacterized protein (TIGR02246 family)
MKRVFLLLAVPILMTTLTWPQAASEAEIRHQMDQQVAAWNRGDVNAFMTAYEDSPETTFVGDKVEHGYAQILERYRKHYATQAAMGKLSFSNMEIRVLDGKYAVATGNFHLDRSADAGGNTGGIFSLLLRRGPAGWKIILDHTNRIP